MEEQEQQLILCPYCGNTQNVPDRCEICGGLFEPLSRKATQISMGPWYLRDKNLPFLPGCSYDILLRHIRAGRIKPTTIMRGPTTHQFWSIARHVPGVAHLLGYCHQCNFRVEPGSSNCPSCGAVFESIRQRNELGLIYPDDKSVTVAQMRLEWEQAQRTGRFPSPIPPAVPASSSEGATGEAAAHTSARPAATTPSSGAGSGRPAAKTSGQAVGMGLDLLEEVLGGLPPESPRGTGSPPTSPTAAVAPPVTTPARGGETAGPAVRRSSSAASPGRMGTINPSAPSSSAAVLQRGPATPPPLPKTPMADASGSPLLDFSIEAPLAAPEPSATSTAGAMGPSGVPMPELEDEGHRMTMTFWLVAGGTFLAIVVIALLVVYMLKHPGT